MNCIILSMHTWTPYFFGFLLSLFVWLFARSLHLSYSPYYTHSSDLQVTNVTNLECIFLYLSPFSYHYTQIYKHIYKNWSSLFYKNIFIYLYDLQLCRYSKIYLYIYMIYNYEMSWRGSSGIYIYTHTYRWWSPTYEV